MNQDDRAAAPVVLVVDLDRGTVLGASESTASKSAASKPAARRKQFTTKRLQNRIIRLHKRRFLI